MKGTLSRQPENLSGRCFLFVVQGTPCYYGVHLATALIQLKRKAWRRYVNGLLRRILFIVRKAKKLLVRVILVATAAVNCMYYVEMEKVE